MTIEYYPELDVVHVALKAEWKPEGEQIAPGVLAQYDDEGGLARLEFGDVSQGISLSVLVERLSERQTERLTIAFNAMGIELV